MGLNGTILLYISSQHFPGGLCQLFICDFSTFIVAYKTNFPLYFTFRHRKDFREDDIIRHIEPPMAAHLEIARLRNFHIRWVCALDSWLVPFGIVCACDMFRAVSSVFVCVSYVCSMSVPWVFHGCVPWVFQGCSMGVPYGCFVGVSWVCSVGVAAWVKNIFLEWNFFLDLPWPIFLFFSWLKMFSSPKKFDNFWIGWILR